MKLRSLLAIMAVLGAACGGAGTTPTEDGSSVDDTVTETSTGEEASGDAATISDFFGYEDFDESEYQDQEARVQEAIRQCMAAEGFDYQPIVPPDQAFSGPIDFDQEEYARTQGFGVTTWYGNEDEFFGDDPGMEWVDPNQETIESMSESEQTAWYEALYGTPEEQEAAQTVEVDEETGETYYMQEGNGPGCQGEAYDAEYGNFDDTQDLWEQLNPAFEAMYAKVTSDPRVVDLMTSWSSCMTDAGFEFTDRDAMYESAYTDLQARFDEIVGPNGGYADPFEGWTEDEINTFFEEKSQDEIDAFFEDAESSSRAEIDTAALEALQQEEIDMAVADLECWGDNDEIYQEVSEEYESEFIQANLSILQEIRDAENR